MLDNCLAPEKSETPRRKFLKSFSGISESKPEFCDKNQIIQDKGLIPSSSDNLSTVMNRILFRRNIFQTRVMDVAGSCKYDR